MQVAVFSTKSYDRSSLEAANQAHHHKLHFFEARLTPETATLAEGLEVACLFVNDRVDATCARKLADGGVRLLALRSAGFNHVDLRAAEACAITVARVPAYSPEAVAEHAVALILTLNRKTHRAYNRVREGNFTLQGLTGFDLHGRTVGVVGMGKIGAAFVRIMRGFGCQVLAYDPHVDQECRDLGAHYVKALDELWSESDIVSLHCPLTPQTHHLIDGAALERMKPGVMIINTGRGGLLDTRAVIGALKRGQVGHLGLDVYEEEEALFFQDLSDQVIQDDVLMRLVTFPNV